MRQKWSLVAVVLAVGLTIAWRPGVAEEPNGVLGVPMESVILKVSGKIKTANVDDHAEFDRTMLEHLGVATVTTHTPWTDGEPVFRGVLARDVLAAVGAQGATITAVALDDYEYTIPASDFQKYPILLAMEMNGDPMTARDLGPIWIVYPRTEYPELDTKETDHRMVWQVRELIVE